MPYQTQHKGDRSTDTKSSLHDRKSTSLDYDNMLALPPALTVLAFTAALVYATPASIPLYIKAGIAPGRSIPKTGDDVLVTPPAYHSPYDTSSSGLRPGSWIDNEGHPIPPTADEIQYAPAPQKNSCFSSENCREVLEVAAEVMENLVDAISGGFGSSTTTSAFGSAPSISNSTRILRTMIPNGDTAITVANSGVEDEYMGLFSEDEQSMFVDSPVCFFANMERMYSAASVASVTSIAATTSTTDSSKSKFKRGDILGYIQSCENNGCSEPTATLSSDKSQALQTAFFQDTLPSKLRSIYAAATSTGLETATTTCSAFDDGTTYTTSFVQRAALTTSVTATPTALTRPIGNSGVRHDKAFAGMAFAGLFGISLL